MRIIKMKVGTRCKIIYLPSLTNKKVSYSASYYPQDILDKLRKYYPKWDDLFGKTGCITQININKATHERYCYFNLSERPDVYIIFEESWLEEIKDTKTGKTTRLIPNNIHKCNCPFDLIWSDGCKCGGI